MELIVKHFNELSRDELFEILKLRTAVFVVEQQNPCREIDDADRGAYHIWLQDEGGIAAYLRLLPKGVTHDGVALGRILSAKRGVGLGARIVQEGLKAAKRLYGVRSVTIDAQCYAKGFYEKQGFRQVSEEFMEEGIPHVRMVWEA